MEKVLYQFPAWVGGMYTHVPCAFVSGLHTTANGRVVVSCQEALRNLCCAGEVGGGAPDLRTWELRGGKAPTYHAPTWGWWWEWELTVTDTRDLTGEMTVF